MTAGSFDVELSPSAERQLRKLHKAVAECIVAALRGLTHDPRPPGVKALKNLPGALRIRVGKDYRVVYEIHDEKLLVVIPTR